MVEHLYADFLKNKQEYRRAERFWEALWEELVNAAGVAEKWQHPWLGADLQDGDPMFSAVSPMQGRGVHIIQHAPTSDQLELVYWVDKFGEEGIDDVIYQLVISCALSREAAAQASALLWSWVTRGKVELTDPYGFGPRVKTPVQAPEEDPQLCA
jgi:hypothetical protein